MAEHAAAIGRVHLDRLRDSGKPEGRPGKKIADNRLQVAVGQAAARLKRREPPAGSPARRVSPTHCDFHVFLGHGNSGNRQFGRLAAYAVRERLGRLVGIEPTTS